MGTALINLSKQNKLGASGQGRLTEEKPVKFQHYRHDIVNNIWSQENMCEGTWPSLFHCISTDESPKHNRCPTGPDSWCFYQKDVASGSEILSHGTTVTHPLTASVVQQMIPVYERMSDTNLLKWMERVNAQNPNECLHSIYWEAIASFNEGSFRLSHVMQKMAIETN